MEINGEIRRYYQNLYKTYCVKKISFQILYVEKGIWGKWSAWSVCSVTCGDFGTRKRTRKCISKKDAHDKQLAKILVNLGKSGDSCSEDLVEREKCGANVPCNLGNIPCWLWLFRGHDVIICNISPCDIYKNPFFRKFRKNRRALGEPNNNKNTCITER